MKTVRLRNFSPENRRRKTPRRSVLCALVFSAAFLAGLMIAAPFSNDARAVEKNKTYTIFAVLWRGETEVETGFRAYVRERNLPFNIIVRSADQDATRLPQIIEEIRKTKPDLIYTWGTTNATTVVGRMEEIDPEKHITDIPVVFTMVSFPEGSRLITDRASSGRNITGVSHIVPLDTQVKAMEAFMPIDRIAVIYSPSEPNSVLNVNELRAMAEEGNFKVFPFPASLDEAGKPSADEIPSLVDEAASIDPQFLYLGPDSFIGQNHKLITAEAKRAGIATFTATEVMIRDSEALYGLVSPYRDVGRLTARKAEQILLEGKHPSEIPVETLQRFSYQINMQVAKRLGIYPAMPLLSYAEVLNQ